MGFIARFLSDDDGATAIEYGLICALLVLVILTVLAAVGGSNESGYSRVMQKISGVLTA